MEAVLQRLESEAVNWGAESPCRTDGAQGFDVRGTQLKAPVCAVASPPGFSGTVGFSPAKKMFKMPLEHTFPSWASLTFDRSKSAHSTQTQPDGPNSVKPAPATTSKLQPPRSVTSPFDLVQVEHVRVAAGQACHEILAYMLHASGAGESHPLGSWKDLMSVLETPSIGHHDRLTQVAASLTAWRTLRCRNLWCRKQEDGPCMDRSARCPRAVGRRLLKTS